MINEKIYRLAGRIWNGELAYEHLPIGVEFSDGGRGFVVAEPRHDDVLILPDAPAIQGYLRYQSQLLMGSLRTGPLGNEAAYRLDETYLSLHFGAREELSAGEQEQLDALRGPEGEEFWPVLRLMVPFVLPMEVTDPELLRRAEEALEGLCWFGQNGKPEGSEEKRALLPARIPYLRRQGESFSLEHGPAPEFEEKVWPLVKVRGPLTARVSALRQLPAAGEWEMALSVMDDEEEERERLVPGNAERRGMPVSLLAIRDDEPESIAPEELGVRDFADHPLHLLEKLTDCFAQRGEVPRSVLVSDERTERLLKNWCRVAGVKLRRVRELERVGELRERVGSEMLEQARQTLQREQQETDPQRQPLTRALRAAAAETEEEILSWSPMHLNLLDQDEYDRLCLMGEFGILSEKAMEKLRSRQEVTEKSFLTSLTDYFEQLGPEDLALLQEAVPGADMDEFRQMMRLLKEKAQEME